ncbi:Cold-shock DEAD-box protein A [Lunatimonas lonarensis]|uniref:Cold-shock DEAD-box protein A n=1 Tax=Lunatimonas lonarensis TaxID=1232681 RepID=R7ZTW7_9BACT|nr:DEAD/DEAH box helicase [Lunatimonas lonarensis]EON77488.1 Cold-shock DEAD-box protein A [Lunatimonas lonarensis]
MEEKITFKDFNLIEALQEGLDAMGFETPTPIQQQAIPVILSGKDLIATAQTGTGKTAAFILPILHHIVSRQVQGVNALILAPTRELAIQIDQQIQGLAYFLGISSIPIYGGGDGVTWDQQKKALQMGAEIIVATPGRLIALLQGGKINLESLRYLILDEADRMMDMGFSEDLLTIVNYLPTKRQTLLFSATMPPKIRKFSKQILVDPAEISIALGKTAKGVAQFVYMAYDTQKEGLILHILKQKPYEAVIVFCSTKDKVKSLFKVLRKSFDVEAFHADLDQAEREKIMSAFKSKKVKILVATDILSRGIDVEDIELVINFDTPNDPEDYVHRVGRTARAQKEGTAITLVNDKDRYKYANIEKLIGLEIEKLPLPEELGEGPSLAGSANRKEGPRNKPKRSGGSGSKQGLRSGQHGKRANLSEAPIQETGQKPKGKSRRFPPRKNSEKGISEGSSPQDGSANPTPSGESKPQKFRARRNISE